MKNRNAIEIYEHGTFGALLRIPAGERWELAHNLPEKSPGNPMYWLKPSGWMEPRLRSIASRKTGTGVCMDRDTLRGVNKKLS